MSQYINPYTIVEVQKAKVNFLKNRAIFDVAMPIRHQALYLFRVGLKT